jgi:hypothetical protein
MATLLLTLPFHTPPPGIDPSVLGEQSIPIAGLVRHRAIQIYSIFMPWLLGLGAFCAGVLAIHAVVTRSCSFAVCVAWAAWLISLCRVAALVLVSISAFPAVFSMYLGYAFAFAHYGALISIFLAGKLARSATFRWRRPIVNASQA